MKLLKDPSLKDINIGNINLSILHTLIIVLVGMIGNKLLTALLIGFLSFITVSLCLPFLVLYFLESEFPEVHINGRSNIGLLITISMIVVVVYYLCIGIIPSILYMLYRIPFIYFVYNTQMIKDTEYTRKYRLSEVLGNGGK